MIVADVVVVVPRDLLASLVNDTESWLLDAADINHPRTIDLLVINLFNDLLILVIGIRSLYFDSVNGLPLLELFGS